MVFSNQTQSDVAFLLPNQTTTLCAFISDSQVIRITIRLSFGPKKAFFCKNRKKRLGASISSHPSTYRTLSIFWYFYTHTNTHTHTHSLTHSLTTYTLPIHSYCTSTHFTLKKWVWCFYFIFIIIIIIIITIIIFFFFNSILLRKIWTILFYFAFG